MKMKDIIKESVRASIQDTILQIHEERLNEDIDMYVQAALKVVPALIGLSVSRFLINKVIRNRTKKLYNDNYEKVDSRFNKESYNRFGFSDEEYRLLAIGRNLYWNTSVYMDEADPSFHELESYISEKIKPVVAKAKLTKFPKNGIYKENEPISRKFGDAATANAIAFYSIASLSEDAEKFTKSVVKVKNPITSERELNQQLNQVVARMRQRDVI